MGSVIAWRVCVTGRYAVTIQYIVLVISVCIKPR